MSKNVKMLNLNKDLKINYNNDLLFEFKQNLNKHKEIKEKYLLNEITKKNNISSVLNFLFSKNSTLGTNAIEKININDIELSKEFIEKTKDKNIDNQINIDTSFNLLSTYLYDEIDLSNLDVWSKKIHKKIFSPDKNKNPGKFKLKVNFIPNINGEPVKIFLEPKEVEKELFRLGVFASNYIVEPIILAAIVHAHFIGIHPFKDGNGRMGRLISDKIIQSGYNEFLFIDEAINLSLNSYISSLNEYHFNGSLEFIINFFLSSGIQQLNRNIDILNNTMLEIQKIKEILKNNNLKKYDESSYLIMKNGIINVSIISKELNIHRDTAKKIINILCENEVLEPLKNYGKAKIYIKK